MWYFSLLVFCFASAALTACDAFVSCRSREHSARYLAASSSDDVEQNSDDNPFALPPIGESSFQEPTNVGVSSGAKSPGIKISDEVASPKFELQYTCKICTTRNSHRISRMAYRKGVVIAVCKGCESKHLIADNLGWQIGFDSDKGERTIEQFMQNRNEESGEEDLVQRVDKEVFELEKILYKESKVESSVSPSEKDHWS
jgi:hypothetical protein